MEAMNKTTDFMEKNRRYETGDNWGKALTRLRPASDDVRALFDDLYNISSSGAVERLVGSGLTIIGAGLFVVVAGAQ